MSGATDVPDFLQLQPAARAPAGIRAQAAALVAQVQGAAAQARSAIAWSVGLSIVAVAMATGTLVYVVASDR